jgi:probable HAF family extracellular repeat protein
MHYIGHSSVVIAALVFSTSVSIAAPLRTYSIVDLGAGFSPVDINEAGQIVGNQVIEGASRAFVYDIDSKTRQDLGTLGGMSTTAHAINNAGLIVGYSDSFQGSRQPFVFDGQLNDIGVPDPINFYPFMASAQDVNDSGLIVGDAVVSVSESGCNSPGDPRPCTTTIVQHAALDNGDVDVLGSLGGRRVLPFEVHDLSIGHAVNNSGHVVGGALAPPNGVEHAFLYNGAMRDLGTLQGGSSSVRR